MYRVEDKFICTAQEMYYLQKRLSNVLQSDSNEKNTEGYSISSLYFDDLQDSCFSDTIEGNRIRSKYRIRIYDHSLNLLKLEVKEKLDNRTRKKSRIITKDELMQLMNGECIKDQSSLEDPATLFNLAIRMHGLKPKIIVTYERKAFVYDAGNVRITFDKNIRCSNKIAQFGTSNINYDFLRDQAEIVEMKYDTLMPQFILQLLELGNMQQTAYSKYQLCRQIYL